ncbi:hypothetical protein [Salibacterium aidingense]|nr:hypothetical protein [Salibacterium aidingense]
MKKNMTKLKEFLTDVLYSFFIFEYENLFEDEKEKMHQHRK